jgi:hypothetical protein
MPSLPIPLAFPAPLDAADLPVHGLEDVLSVMPDDHERADPAEAPVFHALVEAEAELFLAYQARASYAAAQSDPTLATGIFLAEFGRDVHVLWQRDVESAEAFRDRLFGRFKGAAPEVIKAAVDAFLEPYTSARCELFEPLSDRLYLFDGAGSGHALVGDGVDDIAPAYPWRRYELREHSSPGGALLFAESYPRSFWLRVPDLAGSEAVAAFVTAAASETDPESGLFLDDGADELAGAFLFDARQTADAVYAAIIHAVDLLAGHGVSWTLLIDPKLNDKA